MGYQNFQEAIEQLSTNECMNPEEIKSQFDLNEEDMMAMQSYNPLIQAKMTQIHTLCCCCM